jgi:hypothetical protein
VQFQGVRKELYYACACVVWYDGHICHEICACVSLCSVLIIHMSRGLQLERGQG